RKSRLPATRPCLVPLFRPSTRKSAIATKPEPLPCLTQRPPSSERNGSLMLRPSFKSSAWSMHSNPRPAFGRPQPKHHSICPTVRSTQTMPRTPFASTGGSRTSSTTRVMSRYVKTRRASEKILASSRECGAHTRASFPQGVNAPVQYGQKIAAFVIYLLHYQLLPED